MTENNVSRAKAQAAYEDAQAICTGFEGASDLMDRSFNPERTPFADLDFQAGWNTAKAAKAAAIERLEREEAARPVATLFWEGDESTVPEFCPHGRKPYWYQNAFFVGCPECVAAAIELTQGLKKAFSAYYAAYALAVAEGRPELAEEAHQAIHDATYEAQGPLPDDRAAFAAITPEAWAARMAIRESVDLVQRAIEARVDAAATAPMTTSSVAPATPPGATASREKTVTDNILDGLLDTPFTEIADQISRDAAKLARLEAETAEYVKAMELLRPYMQDFPHRTVREALEIMRADKVAAATAPGDRIVGSNG